MTRLSTILVANRGEIAIRVARSARTLGCRTVAIYTDADAGALHVGSCDVAVRVPSYLDREAVVAAGTQAGCDGVHPGYGFLSENADFARAVAAAGMTFIGPPPDAIALMGNKRASKRAMEAAGVPCVPGYHGDDQRDETLIAEAERIGFPIMVKAAAGGGGRGMRRVTKPADLAAAIRGARSEAEGAFGDGTLLLERALTASRHVEIQVLADTHGRVIHLGERDCSVQRRHQKVIEESPSPAVDEALRTAMGESAVAAARACNYVGAGTVEMLLGDDGHYFLEMNTRLQVEHPVTELVTGVDLVAWQIRIAAGAPLTLGEDGPVPLSGHAIEARLYAEDPARGYLPQSGVIAHFRAPEGVRVDHAVADGVAITPHYDPMIAKVISHGADREEARHQLITALRRLSLFGVVCNRDLLISLLSAPTFAAGEATTSWLEAHPELAARAPVDAAELARIGAVAVWAGARRLGVADELLAWRSSSRIWSTLRLGWDDGEAELRLRRRGDELHVGVTLADEDSEHAISLIGGADGEVVILQDGLRRTLRFANVAATWWIDDGERLRVFADLTHRPSETADAQGSGTLRAPLDGVVLSVDVAVGDHVAKGDVVAIVEAMKMEHRIVADVDGTVATIHVSVGKQAKTKEVLVQLTPAEAANEEES